MKKDIYIGLDIGGTSVRGMIYKGKGQEFGELVKLPFIKYNTAEEEVDNNICQLIDTIIGTSKCSIDDIAGIGISSAPFFCRVSGNIISWPNNPTWNNFPLRNYLGNRYGTEIKLEDDANTYALGELFYGSGYNYSSFIYITVSTGVGCGIIVNRQLYIGENGWAGNLGHMFVAAEGQCVCGEYGCLQAVVSGVALLQQALIINHTSLERVELSELQHVFELVSKDVQWAKDLFSMAGNYIARAILQLVKLLDINTFILGGGVIQGGDIVIEQIRHHLNLNLSMQGKEINVFKSQLGDKGGVLGAVRLLIE